MATLSEVQTLFQTHLAATNPHNDVSTNIWGIYNLDNTSDEDKPISTAFQADLDTKVNISDIYNSTEESSTLDLSELPWSAAQGYSMKNVVDTYQAQDTSALEARILWCETNV